MTSVGQNLPWLVHCCQIFIFDALKVYLNSIIWQPWKCKQQRLILASLEMSILTSSWECFSRANEQEKPIQQEQTGRKIPMNLQIPLILVNKI